LGELCGALSVAFESELNPRAALDSLHGWSGLRKARRLLSPALDRGLSLSQAFISNPRVAPFAGAACLMGERSGKLPQTLQALSEYLSALSAIEEKSRTAKLAFRFSLLACALLVPALTGRFAVLALALIVFAASIIFSKNAYRAPVLGKLARAVSTHSLCQGVRLFRAAGLELHEALAICGAAEKNPLLGRALCKVAQAVEEGRPAWPLLEGCRLDILAIKALEAGDRKGELAAACLRCAKEQRRIALGILDRGVAAVCACSGFAISVAMLTKI
jgi:type II secretory pathway component PulF